MAVYDYETDEEGFVTGPKQRDIGATFAENAKAVGRTITKNTETMMMVMMLMMFLMMQGKVATTSFILIMVLLMMFV